MLPPLIRQTILVTYRPGQEIYKQPSEAYLDATMEARTWITGYLGRFDTKSEGKQTAALSQESIDKLNALRKKV